MTETEPRVPAQAEPSESAQPHDAFVSYSRADREAVVELVAGLDARGLRAWVDLEDIPPSAEWMGEIRAAIEAADGYLVVISPSLAGSKVCAEELELSRQAGKRIVPVMVRSTDPTSVPATLAALNWIDATGGTFDHAVDRVVEALRTDLDHVRAHTKLGVRAAEWERKDDTKALLLRGAEIAEAEAVVASGSEPRATPSQARFVQASRSAAIRRQRSAIGAVAAALVVSLALSAFALVQRGEAIDQRDVAVSGTLASGSLSELETDPETSLLLAIEAAEVERTPLVERALRESLKASHVELVYDEHEDWVNDLAFGPGGDWVATSSDDGTIRIWDPSTGETIRSIELGSGRHARIYALTADPAGRWLAASDETGAIRLWDPETAEERETLRPGGIAYTLAATADGRRLVSAGIGGLDLWEPMTGDRSGGLGPVPGEAYGAGISPDGGTIATAGGDGTIRLWNSGTMQQIKAMRGHQELAFLAAFSDDGTMIVSASEDHTARVWDVDTGRQIAVLPHVALAQDADFVRDTYVVTADSDGVGSIWDLGTGEPVAELRGHESLITYLAVAPADDRIVTTSTDSTARVWRIGTPVSERDLNRGAMTWGSTYSPDGSLVATAGSTPMVELWNASDGSLASQLRPPPTEDPTGLEYGSATFSPDGSVVAATAVRIEGQEPVAAWIQAWDARSGRPIGSVPAPGRVLPFSVAFAPDGARATTVWSGGVATVWDAETFDIVAELEIVERGPDVPGLANMATADFSPDGRVVAVPSGKEVVVWNPDTDRILTTLTGHGSLVNDVEYSADGSRLLTASYDGTARLWSVQTGDVLVTFRGHQGDVVSAAFGDRERLVVTSARDGTARVWLADGTELQRFRAAELAVNDASLSMDSTHILVSTAVGWNNAPTGVPIQEVTTGGARIFRCDVCASYGQQLALARRRVTRALTGEELAAFLGA